jgi:hypothetical protein
MALLGAWGAESGHFHVEGLTLVGTTLTVDTGTKRTGTGSFKFDTSATVILNASFTGATDRTYYACAHVLFPAATGMPTSATSTVLTLRTAAASMIGSIMITSAGKARLFSNAEASQVGSDSATTLTTDTWYRLELVLRVNSAAGADDTLEGYLDGVQIAASSTRTMGTTAPGQMRFGFVDDPGTSIVMYVDDVVLHDDQGGVNDGLPGDVHVSALIPSSDNARTGDVLWTGGAGGTTALYDAVNNTPPVGIQIASDTDTSQIRHDGSGAGVYDANCPAYSTITDLAAVTDIMGVKVVAAVGEEISTGTKNIRLEGVSGPVIASTGDLLVGGSAVAEYPSNWTRQETAFEETTKPAALSTTPVIRINRAETASRACACCFLGLQVVWQTAEVGGAEPRYRSIMMVN